jgi:methylmalonyl-CoA mutase N-terminal domain/subunit
LTNEIEERAIKYIERIDSLGGAVSAIEKGFMQHEITDSAYRNQKQIETKERVVVGVNDFVSQQQAPIRLLQIDPSIEKSLTQKLRETKKTRNKSGVDEELNELRKKAEAKDKENLIPYMLKAVKKYATLGETCEVLREVFGEYKAPSIF